MLKKLIQLINQWVGAKYNKQKILKLSVIEATKRQKSVKFVLTLTEDDLNFILFF